MEDMVAILCEKSTHVLSVDLIGSSLPTHLP